MNTWRALLNRLRHLVRQERFDRSLNGELQFHIESRIEELEQQGYARTDARARAVKEFGSRARIMEDARMGTLASQVLQSEIETLRLKNWSEVSALEESAEFAVDTTLDSASFHRFTCTRTVRPVFTEMRLITVSVDWQSTSGQAKRRSFYSLVGKGGLNDYFYRKI